MQSKIKPFSEVNLYTVSFEMKKQEKMLGTPSCGGNLNCCLMVTYEHISHLYIISAGISFGDIRSVTLP